MSDTNESSNHGPHAAKLQSLSARRFQECGYVVLRDFVTHAECVAVRKAVLGQLQPLLAPCEYEADVGYPGAPDSRTTDGGATPRRLLSAFSRFPELRAIALSQALREALQALGMAQPQLSQAHHNCVMTKHPGYSSATLWHQDIRYWSFDRAELISAWLALGEENEKNGALRVIPGSHLLELDRGRLDAELFLRPELPENRTLIHTAEVVTLAPGDLLLFHCRLFHAAGRNRTEEVKLTPVFTYHSADNEPIPGTRSSVYSSIAL